MHIQRHYTLQTKCNTISSLDSLKENVHFLLFGDRFKRTNHFKLNFPSPPPRLSSSKFA